MNNLNFTNKPLVEHGGHLILLGLVLAVKGDGWVILSVC
jgi:hypothetical protein